MFQEEVLQVVSNLSGRYGMAIDRKGVVDILLLLQQPNSRGRSGSFFLRKGGAQRPHPDNPALLSSNLSVTGAAPVPIMVIERS